MIADIVSPMRRDGLWTLAAWRICPRHRDFSVIARVSLRNLQFCLIKRKILHFQGLRTRCRGKRSPHRSDVLPNSLSPRHRRQKTRSRGAALPGSPLPGGWLALDRVNVDRPQPAHAQYIHLKRAIDPVAIERSDQIVDAVNLNAVQLDHDI